MTIGIEKEIIIVRYTCTESSYPERLPQPPTASEDLTLSFW